MQVRYNETQIIHSPPETPASVLRPDILSLGPSRVGKIAGSMWPPSTILNLLSVGKSLFTDSFISLSTQPQFLNTLTAHETRTPFVHHLDALGLMWHFRLPRIYLPMRHTQN